MIDTASHLYGSSHFFGNASMILSVCGMWQQTMLLLALVLLLGITSAYAADCRTSFDQSCLSRDYDAEQVETDHQAAQEELEASQKAEDEQAAIAGDLHGGLKYLEKEGYERLYLRLIRVRGEDWLVVTDSIQTSATKDLPLLFPTLTFTDGFYFCKKALMGGIIEMIDASGSKQSFLFAEWKNLR